MEFQVGDTINGYQVLGVLGKGGMGKVFRVQNVLSSRVEAMKVIRPELEADTGFADRFLREIVLHAKLDHRNIVRFYTAFRAENRICMIMEYAEGMSLHDRLREGPLVPAEASLYIDQVLSALSYAHRVGVIHRDIKPANIILSPNRVSKLTDFGIAKAAGVSKLTATGMALGSLYYISPEQVRNSNIDARSDVYSLGVTFYEAVTGKRPIEGDTEYSIMNGHLERIPIAPVEVNPELPSALSSIIMRALAKNPADRFSSADDFQAAVRNSGSFNTEMASLVSPASSELPTFAAPRPNVDSVQLEKLQARLSPFVGPIAKILVSQAAAHHLEYSRICASLAEHIPGQRDREAFLRSCKSDSQSFQTGGVSRTTTPPPTQSRASSFESLSPQDLQSIKHKLAAYIGPIASVLVDRTARRTHSRRELCEALAKEIPRERDRSAFLSSVR
jgi:eukaryotic-like serine/threonine-protein kinase